MPVFAVQASGAMPFAPGDAYGVGTGKFGAPTIVGPANDRCAAWAAMSPAERLSTANAFVQGIARSSPTPLFSNDAEMAEYYLNHGVPTGTLPVGDAPHTFDSYQSIAARRLVAALNLRCHVATSPFGDTSGPHYTQGTIQDVNLGSEGTRAGNQMQFVRPVGREDVLLGRLGMTCARWQAQSKDPAVRAQHVQLSLTVNEAEAAQIRDALDAYCGRQAGDLTFAAGQKVTLLDNGVGPAGTKPSGAVSFGVGDAYGVGYGKFGAPTKTGNGYSFGNPSCAYDEGPDDFTDVDAFGHCARYNLRDLLSRSGITCERWRNATWGLPGSSLVQAVTLETVGKFRTAFGMLFGNERQQIFGDTGRTPEQRATALAHAIDAWCLRQGIRDVRQAASERIQTTIAPGAFGKPSGALMTDHPALLPLAGFAIGSIATYFAYKGVQGRR